MIDRFQLTTSRLILRPHRHEDAPFLVELNSDPEVVKYTGDSSLSGEEEARIIVDYLHTQFRDRQIGRFLMVRKSDQKKLGWCGLKWLEESQVLDLGFRILREHWNQGYATEASWACLKYGFEELGYERIVGRAMPKNEASIRVLRKLGMVHVRDVLDRGAKFLELELRREDFRPPA